MARKAPVISGRPPQIKAAAGRVTPKRRQSSSEKASWAAAKGKGGPLHGQPGGGSGGAEEAPF